MERFFKLLLLFQDGDTGEVPEDIQDNFQEDGEVTEGIEHERDVTTETPDRAKMSLDLKIVTVVN